MRRENPLWGASRIYGELPVLGLEVAQSTVTKYMVRTPKPPSQTWTTFLKNNAEAIAAIVTCVVPTLTFDLLFTFLVLGHGRRQVLWFDVTRHPTAEWLARQITEAFPWTSAPTYLVRDNDRVCVPKTLSVLSSRRNHLTSVDNVCTVMLCPSRLGIAIQVEDSA
jgi:transposase